MSLLGALRQCQMDIRLIENQLRRINAEERNDPAKALPNDGADRLTLWSVAKDLYAKRRELLRDRLAELQGERSELERKLGDSPLSRVTLGHVLDRLTEIETKFTAETWGDAWESLTAFIDWLEKEEGRLAEQHRPALKAVS